MLQVYNIFEVKWNNQKINSKREEIKKLIKSNSVNIKNSNINTISVADLHLLFLYYDQVFLKNWFQKNFKGKIIFSLSQRMIKSAGLTHCPKNIATMKQEEVVIEIKIGIDFFFQYGTVKGRDIVCGIKTNNSLNALLLVFEHELCHAIEFICFGKSSCKGNRFKTLAGNLFGHVNSYHELPTYKQIASKKFGLNIGDTVLFNFEGKILKGVLYNINKRATVMVRNDSGPFIDNEGKRYSKYYVPLTLLEGDS